MAESDGKEDLGQLALQKRLADLEALVDKQGGVIDLLKGNVDQTRLAQIEAVLLTASAITVELHDHCGRSSIETNQRELRFRLEPIQNRVQAGADAAASAVDAAQKKDLSHAA